jgi:hypothetical protein
MNLNSLNGLDRFTGLKGLELEQCSIRGNLQIRGKLPDIERLVLEDIYVKSLLELEIFTKLEKLKLHHCTDLESLAGLEQLTNLEELELIDCRNLHNLQGEKVSKLKILILTGIDVKSLLELARFTKLEKLHLKRCSNLTSLEVLDRLTNLEELELTYCSKLDNIQGGPVTRPKKLILNETGVKSLAGLERFTNLEKLVVASCTDLKSLQGLETLTKLGELKLTDCKNLDNLQNVPVSGLTELTLVNTGVTSLAELGHFTKLKALTIVSDPGSLKEEDFNGLRTHPSLKKIFISRHEVDLKIALDALFTGSDKEICVSSEY